jgi:hypothetical protein
LTCGIARDIIINKEAVMDRSDEIPCVFQIPLQYNNGEPVEPEKFISFTDIFNRQFGGYTPLGVIKGGSWHGQVESAQRWEVWVTRDRINVLEEIIKTIGKELSQKEMFLIVPEATVRRYDLRDFGAASTGE